MSSNTTGPTSTPDSPQRHEYTSFSSLLHNGSPKKSKDNQVKKKASREGGVDWHLSSVREEPGAMSREESGRSRDGQRDRSTGRGKKGEKDKEKEHMGLWKMLALTVSMAGSQIAWTVELGLGTPYLLSLGLSEQLTSLVWLAGPISGLIAQPLIGAISDSSTSKYRRRYWIVAATILLVFSGLALAFTEPVAAAIVDLFGGGQGDWDPKRARYVKNTAIGIAVFAFYCLDFALNGLQSSLRNLLMDVVPSEQTSTANAWHGRFAHTGNIIGFALGFLNLANVPILRLVGGGQFRKVCIVALVILVSTVWLTCWTQEEQEHENIFGERKSRLRDVIGTIVEAVRHLPKPIRRVCLVQIFAFMGWFPYLFYSTTYVAVVMAHEQGHEPDVDRATRAGSLALLIYSFIAIFAGTLLPYLAARDRRLLKPVTEKSRHEDGDSDDEEDAEMQKVREMVREWKAEAARAGRPLTLPTMPFMLRNIWTAALILFGVVMASTFFITQVWQATVAIGFVGICWAVACWVPFAIIMEFLKELDDNRAASQAEHSRGQNQNRAGGGPGGREAGRSARPPPYAGLNPHNLPGGLRPQHARAASSPVWHSMPSTPNRPTERSPLTRSYSTADVEELGESMEYTGSGPVAGGTTMGIHNLAIVFPQFVVALVASLIFKLADGDDAPPIPGFMAAEKVFNAPMSGVAWVLRFGGLMALVGALICRKVPPTKTEKAMRRRLAEMREESEE